MFTCIHRIVGRTEWDDAHGALGMGLAWDRCAWDVAANTLILLGV